MKIEELKPTAEVRLWYNGSEVAQYGIVPTSGNNNLPVGTKLYALEQVLPVIHEMAREILRLEVELGMLKEIHGETHKRP